MRLVRRLVPTTDKFDGQKLFTKENAKRVATPLFAVLVLIEATDVVFAVDSVPAILAVSREPFIVFASNAFAILGLRSLYFLLGGMQGKFRYLNIGLGVILAFVGVKMLLIGEPFEIHLPTYVSLAFIALVLTVAIVASLQADKRDHWRGHPRPPDVPVTDAGPAEESAASIPDRLRRGRRGRLPGDLGEPVGDAQPGAVDDEERADESGDHQPARASGRTSRGCRHVPRRQESGTARRRLERDGVGAHRLVGISGEGLGGQVVVADVEIVDRAVTHAATLPVRRPARTSPARRRPRSGGRPSTGGSRRRCRRGGRRGSMTAGRRSSR